MLNYSAGKQSVITTIHPCQSTQNIQTTMHHQRNNNKMEVEVGFEPTNDGFANRCLRPLGYSTTNAVRGRV